MPDYIVNVPATASEVRNFINQERDHFEKDYKIIYELVTNSLQKISVYKIYGRSDRQGGVALKHSRKIRMKFNAYFQAKKASSGSLWTVPDVIGFTIVVPYPSDINYVSAVIDGLIKQKHITNAGILDNLDVSEAERITRENEEKRARSLILTDYGRALMSDGYFACHYNVRAKGARTRRPICEIQIKTVLHDAWGAKSHDLTYKPSGRINQNLIDSFNLLGDTLAKIDQQSDLVRIGIERSTKLREHKKTKVQIAQITAAARVQQRQNPEISEIIETILNVDSNSDIRMLLELQDSLIEMFDDRKRAVCIALCLLAIRAKDGRILQQAQEALETWFEQEEDEINRIRSRSIAALANYCGGDISGAIEMGEETIALIDKINRKKLNKEKQYELDRLANSALTSLAYYHADRIGSHEGILARSDDQAKSYLNRSLQFRARIGLIPGGLDSSAEEIETAITDKNTGFVAFSTLDNEAFVRIQTAKSVEELNKVRAQLDFLHKERPSAWKKTAALLFEYHDYCARAMLAELEIN